jgi:endonuclease/exonuclease/phosphatase family metal-dependent hydrolase
VVIGGDLNTNRDQPMFASEKTLGVLEAEGFADAFKGLKRSNRITWPAKGGYPDATFDYVFVRGADPAGAPLVMRTDLSDHCPVACDIEVGEKQVVAADPSE